MKRVCMAVLLLLMAVGSPAGWAATRAQEPSGFYTSSALGYTITWDATWQISQQESSATTDSLSLVDDASFVFFSGANDGSDAEGAVASFSDFLRSDASFENTQPLAECSGGARSIPSVTACFTYLRIYDAGVAVPEAALLEAWDVGAGVRLLMVATVPEERFADYLARWATFGIVPAETAPESALASAAPSELPLEAKLDGVSFSFDPGVTDADRADVVEGIRLGQEAISNFLGLETLNEIQVRVLGSASAERPDAVASTLGYEIAVYAGGEAWQYAPRLIRIETLVHELTHVYQNQLLGPGETGIPLWFDEGAAEAMGYLAITQIGILDQDDIYELTAYLLTTYPVAGSLEQFEPYGSFTTSAYPLSYVAVQYLLGRSGLSVSALGDFYRAVANGSPVEAAFVAVFGLSLDEYYVEFDAWRISLQQASDFPLDFSPPHGFDRQASASWVHLQPAIERGDQLIVVVTTTPGANCSLGLQFGTGVIDRETFANGDGEAFWLVTIPDDVPVGPATVTASCGADPIKAAVDVR